MRLSSTISEINGNVGQKLQIFPDAMCIHLDTLWALDRQMELVKQYRALHADAR